MHAPHTVTPDQLLAVLSQHRGQARGLHIRELAKKVCGHHDVTLAQERALRKLINDLRMARYAVCGHPTHGYFMAETWAELEHTKNFLRSRAISSLTVFNRLKQISPSHLVTNQMDAFTQPTNDNEFKEALSHE